MNNQIGCAFFGEHTGLMRNFISESLKSKIYFSLALAFIFSIPLSQFLSSRLLVGLAVLSFFAPNLKSNLLHIWQSSWDIILFFLVSLFGLIYTEYLSSGIGVLETRLSFLAIPIVFVKLRNLTTRQHNQLFYAFIIGLSTACVMCLIHSTSTYLDSGDINSFFFYSFTRILNFQPTYFAYFLIFALTFCLYRLYYSSENRNITTKSLGILFLFSMLMLTGGQTAFISMLFIFSFFILQLIIEEKTKLKYLSVTLICVMLIGMFVIKVIEKQDQQVVLNDSWDRFVLWESAIKAIPNVFIGVGTGSAKPVLDEYYMNHGLEQFAYKGYNSHNQFIQLVFSNGLLGVLSLMLLIGRPLYLSLKNNNALGVLYMFPFLIYGVTEVFLGRYQGVVFFALVHQFILSDLSSKRSSVLGSSLQVERKI